MSDFFLLCTVMAEIDPAKKKEGAGKNIYIRLEGGLFFVHFTLCMEKSSRGEMKICGYCSLSMTM